MLALLSTIEAKFSALKTDVSNALSKLHADVTNAVSFTDDEVKAAEVDFFNGIEKADVSVSEAFAAGAKWAASKVAAVTANAGNEPATGGTSTATTAPATGTGTAEPEPAGTSTGTVAEPASTTTEGATGTSAA